MSSALYLGTGSAGISFGITSAETGGLIQNLKIHAGSDKVEVKDNQGKYVGRVDSGFKKEVSYELIPTTGVSAAGASPGVSLALTNSVGTGLLVTDDTDDDRTNSDLRKFSVKATLYPDMT